MSDKRRFLDVWIVETQQVYREVPFSVVADWVQQGRLLEDDRLRPSGTAEWARVADKPEFSAYLPRAEPHRADDEAEALEPVSLDFVATKKRHDGESDDPDMIPLIDVSLVLLIFFMMTAAGGVGPYVRDVPKIDGGGEVFDKGLWIGIDLVGDGNDRVPIYAVGTGTVLPAKEDRDLRSKDEVLERLDAWLARTNDPVDITINAHEAVKSGLVRDLTVELGKKGRRGEKISQIYTGVNEKAQ
jgi:biopolymer transport protein ExbD